MVGVNGTVGQGKTVFSQAIVSHLNALLKPEEGQAITRSLDDYYLTKAERARPEFLALGYNPPGISNRGPAGTHDIEQLRDDLQVLAQTQVGSLTELLSFDKMTDDRALNPYKVQGKVGVFILEGWFIGAETGVEVHKTEPGLKRSVAQALKNYKPLFERLNALWVFQPPASIEDIVIQSLEQEETWRQTSGKTRMTSEQVRRFVEYFYKESWQEGVTSPFPTRAAASFWGVTDLLHRFVKIEPSWP